MNLDVKAFQDEAKNHSLNELLDLLEVDVSHVGQRNADQGLKILIQMDVAQGKITEMASKDLDVRAEVAQVEFLASQLDQNARLFLRQCGGEDRLVQIRSSLVPEREHRWWFLDETYHRQRQKALRNIFTSIGLIVLVVLIVVFVYLAFLKPDPTVTAVYSFQTNAEYALFSQDLNKALDQVNRALALTPKDPRLLILRGVTESKMGHADLATVDYTTAESILGSHNTFLLLRSEAWLKGGDPANALADAREVIEGDPNSAEGFFYAGKAYELLQNVDEAITAYQKASDLAEKQGKTELNAMVRINLAMVMQAMPVPKPNPTPTIR